ncbi:LysM peptidoglycan-binding domain-containing protein [Sinomicrobium oceani]|uniref:LysM peptidoglycan-binding domain-containing protein n=1 Tax=Sinomicrobium oceani TaxID=1150368 RepID=UPI002DD41ECD|nr:LysM peptidoglycan-binding domain-containing protein [Sinomicrobium oceani]
MGTSVSFGDYSPGVLPVTIVVRTAYFARKKTEDIFEETTEEYTVVAGDNLSKIAGNYEGVSYQDIMEENGLNSTVISVGDTLTITSRKKTGEKTSFEKIKNGNAGDEVYIVAEHFGTVSSIQVTLKEKEALLTDGGTLPVLQDESEITTIELCEPEEENLKGTHRYAKVKLRPKEDETLEEWREKLGENEVMGYTDGQRSIPPESYDRMITKEGWEPEYGDTKKSLLSIEVEARGEGEITYGGTDKGNVFLNKEGEWFEMKKGGCCIDITPEMLKKIFPNSKETRRVEVAEAINKYKCDFKINNKERLAHFLGQIGTETAELNALYESYNYSAKTIYNIFLWQVLVNHPTVSDKYTFKYHDLIDGYDTDLTCEYPNPTTVSQKNYGHKRTVENPIEVTKVNGKASWSYEEFKELYSIKSSYVNSKSLFDYVYGCRMGNKDKSTTDGSDYFGVGFIHLTGKEKYKYLDDEWKKIYPNEPKEFMGDDISLLKTNVDIAMRASMIIWTNPSNGTNTKCDEGVDNTTITKVTRDVNGGTNGLSDRKKFTKKAYEVLNEKN